MTKLTTDELVAAIRRLPLGDRRALIERASRQAEEDSERAAASARADSLLGLMSDEPEVVDRACALAYGWRRRSASA